MAAKRFTGRTGSQILFLLMIGSIGCFRDVSHLKAGVTISYDTLVACILSKSAFSVIIW